MSAACPPTTSPSSPPTTPGIAYGLGLTNDGDRVSLITADGTTLVRVSYGDADLTGLTPAVLDASLNLEEDIWGKTYGSHSDLSSEAYSPGTLLDGSGYPGPDGRY